MHDEGAVRDKALSLLARREHSQAELRSKLRARGFRAERVESVLVQLVAEGLLSDERFTEAFVRQRMGKGYGPQRIRHELHLRGIRDELIELHLRVGAEEWQVKAASVRRKRFGATLPDVYKERMRQARFLESRGFTGAQIHHALKTGA